MHVAFFQLLTDPGLPRQVGTNIFPTTRPLGEQSAEVLENRDLFLNFLVQYDLIALNTLQTQPPRKQVTYRSPGQRHFEPPWSENRFAQIDYILTKARWRSSFAAVGTLPQYDYDSDHLPLQATLHLHWKFGSPKPPPKPDRHLWKCDPASVRQYNIQLEQTPLHWETLQETIKDVTLNHRGIQPKTIKLPYLQPHTRDLLKARDDALARNQQPEAKILTAQFRRQVKKDKKQNQKEQLKLSRAPGKTGPH